MKKFFPEYTAVTDNGRCYQTMLYNPTLDLCLVGEPLKGYTNHSFKEACQILGQDGWTVFPGPYLTWGSKDGTKTVHGYSQKFWIYRE